MAFSCSARDPASFDYPIPTGWHVRDVGVSESGLTALVIWQSVPNDQALKGDFASRLLLFDRAGRPVFDLRFENPRFLQMTRDDRIILAEGNEGTSRIAVFDAKGRELFAIPTWGRSSVPALLGREIGLWVPNGPLGKEGIQRLSIIDGGDGRERISFEANCPCGISDPNGFCGFLPIGEGGYYLLGSGKSISLRTYLRPGPDLWKIDDIGGGVVEMSPLDQSRVAVAYQQVDVEQKRFFAGVALVEWRSGNVVFRQESRDPHGLWGSLHVWGVTVRLEGGALLFLANSRGYRLRVPPNQRTSGEWDVAKVRKCVMTNFGKGDELTLDGRHLYRIDRDIIHIEKIEYEEVR